MTPHTTPLDDPRPFLKDSDALCPAARHTPTPPIQRAPLTGIEHQTVALISGTAEELWDVAATIQQTGFAAADDWELVRLTASHLLAALDRAKPALKLHAAQDRR